MSYTINITQAEKSNLSELDFNNIPLGTTFTDHMCICDNEKGEWTKPRSVPRG